MPDQNLPIPDFADDGVLLAVEPPTASRGTIRMLARADVVGVRVDLTGNRRQRTSPDALGRSSGRRRAAGPGPGRRRRRGLTLPIGHGLSRGRWSAPGTDRRR